MPVALNMVPHIAEHVTTRKIGGEVFIMHLISLKTFALNSTASCIWSGIDGVQTIADIVDAVTGEFEVSETECRKEVLEVFDTLAAQGLVIMAARDA